MTSHFPKSLYPRSIQLSLLNDWSGQRSFHGTIECKATQDRQVDLLSLQKSQSCVNGSQCEVFWACYQRCCKLVRSIAVFFRLSSMLSFPFMFHIFLKDKFVSRDLELPCAGLSTLLNLCYGQSNIPAHPLLQGVGKFGSSNNLYFMT